MTTSAGLRFGSDTEPGIRRTGRTRFTYTVERTGRRASADDLERIRRLAVPPAWTDVWIAADADSHLQATGRDARGRKQYRYHPAFTQDRAEVKFDDLTTFGRVLGPLRRRVNRDLAGVSLDHDRVIATVVRLLDVTSLRIGNVEYSRTNDSYGLTTLRDSHAKIRGGSVRFGFAGKSGHEFDVVVENARLAGIVRRCRDLPGQQLFQYRSEGGISPVTSTDVNAYLSAHAAPGVTAKTFRTWNATVLAADTLATLADDEEAPQARTVNTAVDQVAEHLGNTRSVCRNSYIHPAVVAAYLDGALVRAWARRPSAKPSGLTIAERKTLRLLKTRAVRSKARAG
jgi:DNA topoisomerase-1